MYSFLILSFLVTPIANLNIFFSATFISSTCFFVTATVSSPYTIAGLTTELYTFPFTVAGNFLSQITPDTFFHPFHPCCTLLFTSLSQLPLSCLLFNFYFVFCRHSMSTFLRSIKSASSHLLPDIVPIFKVPTITSERLPFHTSRCLFTRLPPLFLLLFSLCSAVA